MLKIKINRFKLEIRINTQQSNRNWKLLKRGKAKGLNFLTM
jgi:hypothetical protein